MGRDAICTIRGRVLHHEGEKDEYSVLGENLCLHAFVQEELAFMLWEISLCCLNLRCALLFCRWCRALLPHLEELAF
jgi:hypothetical protein